jgi:hypothetical protein
MNISLCLNEHFFRYVNLVSIIFLVVTNIRENGDEFMNLDGNATTELASI